MRNVKRTCSEEGGGKEVENGRWREGEESTEPVSPRRPVMLRALTACKLAVDREDEDTLSQHTNRIENAGKRKEKMNFRLMERRKAEEQRGGRTLTIKYAVMPSASMMRAMRRPKRAITGRPIV